MSKPSVSNPIQRFAALVPGAVPLVVAVAIL